MKKYSILFIIFCILLCVSNSSMISCTDDDDDDPTPTPTPTATPTPESEEITFIKNYGGPYLDWGLSAQTTNDDGYIITGTTRVSSEGIQKAFLLKLDKFGNEIWFKTFGPHSSAIGRALQVTSDDGYIVAGTSNGRNIYVVKFDSAGNEMWSKIFIDDEFLKQGTSIQQTLDNGYIVLGTIYSSMTSVINDKIHVVKIDQSGNEMWSNYYGLDDCLCGKSIQQLPDRSFVIAGTIDKSCNYDSRSYDMFSLKLDNQGEELWMRTYGGNYYDTANCICRLSDDEGFIIVGGQELTNGTINILLIKTDLLGYEEWTRLFNFDGDDIGYFVEQTRDKGFVITGDTGSNDMFLLKTDAGGVEQWSQKFGNNLQDGGRSVVQTDDGGYFAVGGLRKGICDMDIFAVRTDKNGNV